MTRGYHSPQVREKSWERTFDRRMPAVVPMDYRYLAQHDGSEMALGRGSGLEGPGERRDRRRQKTPYMNMAFHPLERRLDTAIFRALFASSTNQARQMVVHGAVKVNGKKMIYPGYQLNPGDMFSVEPEKVLYATGARKKLKSSPMSVEENSKQRQDARTLARHQRDDEDSEAGMATIESEEELEAMSMQPEEQEDPKKALKSLMTRASRILDDSKRKLSGKRQQELRDFSRSIKKTMSKLRGIEEGEIEDTIDGLETSLAEILIKIPQEDLPKEARLDTAEAAKAAEASAEQQQEATDAAMEALANPQMRQPGKVDQYRARKDAEMLHAALQRARENPIDASKPYATPWRPREYMSAFAFIPRYLEVNQNICSAVYLRHPVARPGLAEVPTPFHSETLGLAFNWYLRRR
jgi:ribosomal protein S4